MDDENEREIARILQEEANAIESEAAAMAFGGLPPSACFPACSLIDHMAVRPFYGSTSGRGGQKVEILGVRKVRFLRIL